MFGQIFAVDIQICGPDLILVRDGSFSVQLNSSLPELAPIPRLKVRVLFIKQREGYHGKFMNLKITIFYKVFRSSGLSKKNFRGIDCRFEFL